MRKILFLLLLLFSVTVNSQSVMSYYTVNPHYYDSIPQANLIFWVKANGIDTIKKDVFDYISRIGDYSPNANTAIEYTGAKQGLWVANQNNGKPVFRFDGSNDVYSLLNAIGLSGKTGYTIFFVAKYASGGKRQQPFSFGAGETGYTAPFWDYSDLVRFNLNAATRGRMTLDVYSNYNILSNVYDGTQSTDATKLKFFLNNVEQTLTYLNTPVPSAILSIISSCYIGNYDLVDPDYAFQGDISEIIIYDVVLSISDYNKVYDYLNFKY